MKTWTEIYKKYKDAKLMKNFRLFYLQEMLLLPREIIDRVDISPYNIKDIWGYLICFAETDGYDLRIHHYYENGIRTHYGASLQHVQWGADYPEEEGQKTKEKAMLWCADKFFEIGV